MAKLLYHGVNNSMDGKNGGVIRPKGSTSKVVAKYDGKIKADGKFSYGPCELNTARSQQIDGNPYDPRAISTSYSETVARHFATSGNIEDGFVYVIDADRLVKEGVTALEFSDPEHPHEKEVTLILQSHEFIPPSLVIRKYEVKSDLK